MSMAKEFSFDIVSDFDLSEIHNAIDQAQREIANRYDFKGSSAGITFDPKDGNGTILITGDNQFHLDSIADIIRKKLAGREVSQKILDTSTEPTTANMKMSWKIPLKKGLDQEKAKKITKLIRDEFPKAKTQIQGDEVRVSAASNDILEGIIALLNSNDYDFPLNFTNYR